MTTAQSTQHAVEPPSLWLFLWIWLSLGAQSFGGGTATLALIRREVVERRGWMDDSEFVRDWALCQIAPGINLLGLTILIGKRLRGIPGVALALTGLLLPSTTITVVLTAFYAHFRDNQGVRSALHGVIPATVGIGLLTAYKLASPIIAAANQEGKASLLVALGLLVGSAFVIATCNLPVVLVLFVAGGIGALFQYARTRGRNTDRGAL